VLLGLCRLSAGQTGDPNFFQFVTRPDILAPKWDITVYDQDALAPGHWFVAPYENLIQHSWPLWNGPMIYTTSGELIWSGAPFAQYYNTFDFRVSRLAGRDVLTFILPRNSERQEGGIFMESSYEVSKVFDMRGDHQIRPNMHDLNLIDDGKRALMLTTPTQHMSHIVVPGEFDGQCRVEWQGFKEVDVESGETLFEWSAEDKLSVAETTYFPGTGLHKYEQMCSTYWDITHFNAIDKFNDGDYLLSGRHMSTIYKVSLAGSLLDSIADQSQISHKDHSVVWRLGGVKSDFVFNDPRTIFSRQHHVRLRGQNSTHTIVSLFDNAVGDYPQKASAYESWGMLLALRTDTTPMTVELVSRYQKPFNIQDVSLEKARGAVSYLRNGNAFVGWITGSQVSEYTPDGRMLMHANMRRPEAASYRSYKMPWIGRPSAPPDVSARGIANRLRGATTEVYVSWNGDTEARTWNMLRVSTISNASEVVASTPRTGFETKVIYLGLLSHLVMVALDSRGYEIGRSDVISLELSRNLQNNAAADEEVWLQKNPSTWEAVTPWSPHRLAIPEGMQTPDQGSMLLAVFATFAGVGLFIFFRRRRRLHLSRHSSYRSVATDDDDNRLGDEMSYKEKP